MSSLALRHAFSDYHGLAQLGRGVVPDVEATRRMVFISDRRNDHRMPDHFYKAYLDQRLGRARHVAEVPWLVLSQLSRRYLERRDGRVRVRYDRFLEWHELVPFLSPLSVVVAFLVEEGAGPVPGTDPRAFLTAEIGESALIGPLDLHLEDLIDREGLHELHMHLNGSTELEVLWHSAVSGPDAFYREIDGAWKKAPAIAAELYDQMEPGLSPYVVFKRLRAARRVRRLLAVALRHRGLPVGGAGAAGAMSLREIVAAMGEDAADSSLASVRGLSLAEDPGDVVYGLAGQSPVVKEAAWLYAALSRLRDRPDDIVVGTGLYFTLLVHSQVRRLSVQQADEFGFDQFQKYTMVGVREALERRYEARFRQLNLRAPYDMLAHVEGRFAPRDTEAAGREQIARIVSDFQRFAGCRRRDRKTALPTSPPPCMTAAGCPGPPCLWRGRRLGELALVAHFIKRPHSPAEDTARGVRDSGLRSRVDRQARVIKRLVRNGTVSSMLRGVDAAANELHAGPEPFAAAFRIARRAGIARATFHAGEDFRHLVSGMRAVEEALVFLDLRAGDRIGHATALGIDPSLWTARAGSRTLLRRVDLLDDLVFARRHLTLTGGFPAESMRLETLIALHSHALYGETVSPALLDEEWRLRAMDPLVSLSLERSAGVRSGDVPVAALVRLARHSARSAVDAESESEFLHVAGLLERHGIAFDLFCRRHRLGTERRREWVEVDARLLPDEAYSAVQDQVLAEVNRRGVALEALPTSNLRISYYQALKEHHLFRWLGLRGPDLANRPTVVIGSDDPGIFATHLKNEFAAIGAVLRSEYGMSAGEAADALSGLNDAARIRRFRPGSST